MSEKNEVSRAFSAEQKEELFGILRDRFEKNMDRHQGLEWALV